MEIHTAAIRARNEFLEMPGLRLTIRQAERLWALEPSACQHVIEVLVQSAFLQRTPDNQLTRVQA